MKVDAWLRAHRDGQIVHEWAPLHLEANGHFATLRVSTDAVRVKRDGGERVREAAGAYAYQQLADAMGALMPTAKIVEERHRQASVKLQPLVAPLVKAGGTVGTVRSVEVSRAIDKAIQTTTDVVSGAPWLVSNVGKHFVLDKKCSESRAVNHGFVVPTTLCPNNRWKGTPTDPSVALGADWRVIQRLGGAHGFGPVADQDDYSQTVILVDDVCLLDGVEYPTSELYTDPALAALVTHDGLPLPWSRHPGVPRIDAEPVSEPVPSTLPPSVGPAFIAAEKTPASVEEVGAALGRVWTERFGEPPSKASLCVLLAQWALETGRGKAMWNFNLGNQKGKPDGSDGRCWTFFACNELLPAKTANAMLARAGQRRDGMPGRNVAITRVQGDTATVWFYPDHPACCFRAYRTIDEGAADYLGLLHKRFSKAWPAVIAGDPSQFSHLLKASRYYTADEQQYTRSVVSLFEEFRRKL